MSETYDGTPYQAGAHAGALVGHHNNYSMVGPIEAVVVARRYVDEPGNRERTSVEYDVRDLRTGQLIPHAKPVSRSFGVDNGDEIVYHPATKALGDGVEFTRHTRALDSDGDYVLVDFIGGSREKPIIIGALPHGSSNYAARSADGERRFIQHAGTAAVMYADGTVTLVRGGASFTLKPDGSVVIDSPHIILGPSFGNKSPAGVARTGDAVTISVLELYNKLLPYFISSGTPPDPLGSASAQGIVAVGSGVVSASR